MHNKVRSIAVDQIQGFLFSIGEEKCLSAIDLEQNKILGFVKLGNQTPHLLKVDSNNKRVFIATREGLILIFDTSKPTFVMRDYINLNSQQSGIREMVFDVEKQFLLVRMRNGFIHMIMASYKIGQKMRIVSSVNTSQENLNDTMSKFQWMQNMGCYCEGSLKGQFYVRDLNGECLLRLTTFTDKVELINYSAEKNLLFSSSRDGTFCVWKVPKEWRAKWVE